MTLATRWSRAAGAPRWRFPCRRVRDGGGRCHLGGLRGSRRARGRSPMPGDAAHRPPGTGRTEAPRPAGEAEGTHRHRSPYWRRMGPGRAAPGPPRVMTSAPSEGVTGHRWACITTAHRGQNVPYDPQRTTPGVGRADVWVFDAEHLGTVLGDGRQPSQEEHGCNSRQQRKQSCTAAVLASQHGCTSAWSASSGLWASPASAVPAQAPRPCVTPGQIDAASLTRHGHTDHASCARSPRCWSRSWAVRLSPSQLWPSTTPPPAKAIPHQARTA